MFGNDSRSCRFYFLLINGMCVDDENFAPWLLTAPALFKESFEEFLIVGSVSSIHVSLILLKLILF